MQSTYPQLLHLSGRQTNTICLFAVIAALLIAVPLHAQPMFKLVDVLEPLYPDSNSLEQYGRDYEAHFPSGTVADVHVLVAARPGDTFTISALMEGVVVPATCWSQLVDVPVEQNTGLDSRTEMFTNQVNPYVIRRAPFRVYEALQPLATATVTAKKPFTAFRLSVPPGMLTSQGKHRILISATGKTWQQLGTFTADIHRVSVPKLRESTFFYTNWYSLPQMEEKHGVARWSKEWYAMLDRYAALMAYGRQNCIIVPASSSLLPTAGFPWMNRRWQASSTSSSVWVPLLRVATPDVSRRRGRLGRPRTEGVSHKEAIRDCRGEEGCRDHRQVDPGLHLNTRPE